MAGYTYSQGTSGGGGGGGGSSLSENTSSGLSQGTSSSTPSILQSPQSELEQQIAQYAEQLATQQYNWGLDQYANTSAMTNASIDNYLAASQQDMSLANQTMQQYQQTTVPEINQQANEAAQYTSPSRIGINMGMAESQSEQGTNAALQAAKQNLQSYGINPSSGEYAELQMANKTAGGAAAAGAGTQAELATEGTGRQLLAQSIATGQQLPGQAINAVNSAYQGTAGAENSALANANTGVALTDTGPSSSLTSAMNLKYPGIGNTSVSQNTAANSSQGKSASVTNPTNPTYSQQTSYSYTGAARGGTIPGGFSFAGGGDATEGGFVPQEASPSNGINVDDVPANLNAEEFVIPRDVARWKGEEFWHKEIAKSRAARAKAQQSVGPTMGLPQAPGQQPTFDSQSAEHGGSISARHRLRNLDMDEFLNQRHMYGGGGI